MILKIRQVSSVPTAAPLLFVIYAAFTVDVFRPWCVAPP
jgi:hypothetical protein